MKKLDSVARVLLSLPSNPLKKKRKIFREKLKLSQLPTRLTSSKGPLESVRSLNMVSFSQALTTEQFGQ